MNGPRQHQLFAIASDFAIRDTIVLKNAASLERCLRVARGFIPWPS